LSAQQSRRQIERRGERVSGLAWMPDQASLIVASGTDAVGQISVWDVPTLQQQRTIKGDTHPRTPVAVSSDGRFIAFSDRKHAIRLVDARTGADTRQLRGHTAPVTALVFASGGRSLLSGGLDSAVRLWDIRRDPREAETGHFTVATGPVTGLALHPNGQVLAVTGAGPLTSEGVAVANVQLWDLVSRRGGEPLRGHPGGAVGVAFTSDGGTLISIGNDRSLKLWDHPGRLEQATLRGHTGTAGTVALSGHGRTLAWIARGEGLGGRGQEINVMDLVAGTLINVFRGHGRPIQALAISGDGRQLAAAAGHLDEPAELLVWEVRTGRLLQAMTGHTNEVVAVAFSPAGNSLASASRDGAIKTWDLSTGKTRMQIAAQIQSVNVLVWSGDGGSLALCAGTAQGGTLLVLDATSGNLRAQGNTTESPTCLALAKDGSWAAYAGGGGQVHLVDVETGKERDPLVIGMKGISYLAISPDGQTLAVAGTAPSVKLWDVPTAQERASLPRHRGGACFVGFADDSRQLVSVSVTQTARVWNSATTR
jgi:WD40 repeat protein